LAQREQPGRWNDLRHPVPAVYEDTGVVRNGFLLGSDSTLFRRRQFGGWCGQLFPHRTIFQSTRDLGFSEAMKARFISINC